MFVLGGFGLIGSKVVTNLMSVGAKVFVLDIKKKQMHETVKYE